MAYLVRGLAAAAAIAALTLHHHHFHGPAIGYAGVALAAAISWAGLSGPGEATLITAGVLAAHQRLDIGAVLVVAWIGATLGGVVGWLGGGKAGRPIFEAPGPLRRLRLRVLALGDRLFARHGMLAVFMTPSWVAGINRMPWTRYLPANALSALIWSLSIGLVAFFVGPPIAHLLADLGGWLAVIVGVAALAALGFERWRRPRRADAMEEPSPPRT
jgi:membrane protein DedA with SNARE-associated domain